MVRKTTIGKAKPASRIKAKKVAANKPLWRNKHMWTQIINILIAILIAFFFYRLGVSRKDIKKGVTEVKTHVDNGLINVKQEITLLRQDVLRSEDYKKYLEMYQVLYKSILEKSFPGGYTTFGVRDSSIFNPGTFSNENIQVDVEGTISFNGRDCSVTIFSKRIYFVETKNSISNISFTLNINNYELGRMYNVNNLVTAVGWKQDILILSDDIVNPVFVFGFTKL